MTRTTRDLTCRRWVAGVLAVLIGLGPLATPSYAALTALADQPLSVQNQAKPNIVLTVDDSTSMLFDYLPDTVVQRKYCRDITGNANALCGDFGSNVDISAQNRGKYITPGYIFQQYGIPYGAYNPSYSASGPGAGCELGSVPTSTCSGGIDPGPLPGLERYPNPPGPPPAKSPKAGQEYEYWTLWPAPVHNSEVNHAYYNPRLSYDPPVYADGSSYPQMDAANSTTWTRVPADPWASTIQYIDLTRNVTIGLWCNSDWTDPRPPNNPSLMADPAYCRTNGTGPSAATASASTPDGDYNYPWAPPGVSPGNGPTTAKSIAWSKVDSATHVIKPAWATAQDPKYFYENDNILWCDSTNPLWPNQGPLTTQTCVGGSVTPQVCNGTIDQTCTAGTPQTCAGVTPQTCGGQQSQTCGNYNAQTCNGTVTQVCNGSTPQTCAGVGPQTCAGITGQTCDNITPQTCGNYTGQACNGVTPQVCNLVAPVCVPPDPMTCTTDWNDPRCPCTGDECPACYLVTTCPPGTCSSNGASCNTAADCPSSGTCSSSGAACTNNAQCPTLQGTCARTGGGCFVTGDCPTTGTCSINTLATCQTNADCPTLAGRCTIDNNLCFSNAACPNEGHCSIVNNICTSDAQCPTQSGRCTVSNAACFDNSGCPDTGGTCSVSNAACVNDTQCPTILGACSINGQSCTVNTDCPPAGQCSIVPSVCTSDAQCPIVPGTCSASPVACTVDANCPTIAGRCTVSNAACFDNGGCPPVGQTCSITGQACSSTPYYPICKLDFVTTCAEPSFCPIQGGTCSIDSSACTHFFWNFWPFFAYDIAYCFPVTTLGQCSIDRSNCTYDWQCPATQGPSVNATCSDKLSDNSRSLLEDANGAGVVCRHNNKTYGATLASRYNYPNATYNTPVTAGNDANACVASNRYALVPRHYWKTSVEWCDKQIATPADKWLGYGTPTGGTCQDSQDATHVFPRFYQFGQDPGTDNYAIPGFQRIDLDIANRFTATYVHNWKDDTGSPQSITRNFDAEMTNYANWFAYYRTRITAVKTVTSLAFKDIDTKYRVGFHTLFALSSFLNIDDFGAAQKASWFAKLFGVTIPLGQETPSLSAVVRIGEYYKNGTHPQLAGSTDPIVLSCQKNFHMFFTDGFTNENGLPSTLVGNQDDTVPAAGYPDMVTKPINGLIPSAAFPKLYREDAVNGSASNSLSDYAMYYWITDLRPAMPNNVLTPPPPLDMYVGDPASWQHLNFAALSLGTSGKLPASNPTTTEAQLKAGTLQWPKPFPSVNKPDNSGVDDLWHAAVNGHGQFVNAESAQDLKQGIGQILVGIANQSGTRAGVGFISNTFGASANIRYQVGFVPGWAGTVTKVQIVPTTGQPIAVNPIQWEASAQLAAQLTIVPGFKDTPWFSERKIVTMNEAGTKVPFLWANLGSKQKDSLAPGSALRGQAVLEYLRGNPLKEGPKVGQLRKRTSPLGDVVDSSAVYVGPPNAPYLDGNDPGYSGFRTTFAARDKRVYVGANDGMLHVFNDATGNETWAYIPTPLFRGGTAGGDFRAGLGALALQDGAIPAFRHHFYVDVTPRIIDADFGAGDWHTVLVGGLGKGGNRYYALDITQPAAITSEVAAATQILWEFPPVGDTGTDMGYSYGRPLIAKTQQFGWTAIVPSGYNNPSGVGKLYFLNISNAAVLKSMSTGAGTPGSPSGFAHPAGYTKDYRNQLVEQLYGGDLLGNFWRFDVSAASAASWTSGQLASLVDGVAAAQPVTTPPEIKIDIVNGIDRWVFVGTGRLLDDSDLQIPNPPQQQTMYAIRDGTSDAPWLLPVTPISRTTVGMLPLSHLAALDFGLASKPDKGWFDDLPIGQRIVVPPQGALGLIAYIGTRAQTDPCLTGLPVNIYARDYTTGKSLLTENDDGTGPVVETLPDEAGGVGLQIVSFETAPGNTVPDVHIAITRADGSVRYIKPKLPAFVFQHRMSWRLIGQ